MKLHKFKYTLSLLAMAGALEASAQSIPSFSGIELPCSNKMFQGNHIWMDHNNDGKMDLLLKGRDLNDGWAIKVLLLSNNGESFSMTDLAGKIETEGTYQKVLAPIDYNNDGFVDLLYVGDGVAKLYRNTKGNSFKEVPGFEMADMSNEEETLYSGTISIADFDADGFQDIATFDTERNIVIYRNNGGDGTFMLAENVFPADAVSGLSSGSLCWGDYDNDGRPDLLVSGWANDGTYAVIYRNIGNGTFEKKAIDQRDGGVVTGTQKGQVAWVDINGDGRQDIILTGEICSNGNWGKSCAFYLNTGDEANPFRRMDAGLPNVQKCGLDWADLNGDGQMDLVYAGEQDGNTITAFLINKGDDTFEVKTDLVPGFRSGTVIGLYDYDNNGFVDLCAMGYNDNLTFGVFQNNGNSVQNTAPSAPSGLNAVWDEEKVIFSWDAGSDTESPTASLRYNLFVRLKNDEVISLIPANLTTGTLSLGNCGNALTTRTYSLNIHPEEIAQWGVQSIDQGKKSSAFVTSSEINTGITAPMKQEMCVIKVREGKIYLNIDEAARIEVYNHMGQLIGAEVVNPGECMKAVFSSNIYIVKISSEKIQQTLNVTI